MKNIVFFFLKLVPEGGGGTGPEGTSPPGLAPPKKEGNKKEGFWLRHRKGG